MLAIIGEHFDVGNEVCGAVISVRFSEDILSIWNRNADNTEATAKLAETCVTREVCAIAFAPRFTARFLRPHTGSSGCSTSRNSSRWSTCGTQNR